jgi:hypothetical protein
MAPDKLLQPKTNLRDPSAKDNKPRRLITNEELEKHSPTLTGTIMPDGQKYEDWLKSKGGAEDGKSGGSS